MQISNVLKHGEWHSLPHFEEGLEGVGSVEDNADSVVVEVMAVAEGTVQYFRSRRDSRSHLDWNGPRDLIRFDLRGWATNYFQKRACHRVGHTHKRP